MPLGRNQCGCSHGAHPTHPTRHPQLRELVPPQGSGDAAAGAADMLGGGEGRRPKHVVLSDTIRLIRGLRVQLAEAQTGGAGEGGGGSGRSGPASYGYPPPEEQQQQGLGAAHARRHSWDGATAPAAPLHPELPRPPEPDADGSGGAESGVAVELEDGAIRYVKVRWAGWGDWDSGVYTRSPSVAHPPAPPACQHPVPLLLPAPACQPHPTDPCPCPRPRQVTCPDRHGLLADVVRALRELPLEITTAAITTRRDAWVHDVFQARVESGLARCFSSLGATCWLGSQLGWCRAACQATLAGPQLATTRDPLCRCKWRTRTCGRSRWRVRCRRRCAHPSRAPTRSARRTARSARWRRAWGARATAAALTLARVALASPSGRQPSGYIRFSSSSNFDSLPASPSAPRDAPPVDLPCLPLPALLPRAWPSILPSSFLQQPLQLPVTVGQAQA